MTSRKWRSSLAGGWPDPVLRSWLTEPGSLTARCQRACRDFRVRLLEYGRDLPHADEMPRRRLARVREVVLECDGAPVIFAHSVLSTATSGRLTRWLAGLGSRFLPATEASSCATIWNPHFSITRRPAGLVTRQANNNLSCRW